MLAFFNSFQIVAAFVAWPFLISWLADQAFRGAGAAYWLSLAMYVVLFGAHVGCVMYTIETAK